MNAYFAALRLCVRFAFVAVAGLLWMAAPATAAPRNIVLFVADDLGPDLGCYGNKVIQTPNIDRLAAEGTRFTHAFCTTASCSPSRSVILSGLHNHANGMYGLAHAHHKFSSYPNIPTLPVLLAKAGYRTARAGKFHVVPEPTYHFQTTISENARSPIELADQCRPFLEEKSDQPFFLYFCTIDPHRSGGVVADDPHKPNPFGNRPGGHVGEKPVKYDPKEVLVPSFLPDTPACRAELAQYYQSVSRVDQAFGRLMQHLKDTGRYDSTLILFTSDHGIAFPGAKTTVYDAGLHIPFLIRHPDAAKRGITSNAMLSFVDLTPTLLEFGGALPGRPTFHGRSFLPIVAEEKPMGWDEIYASHTFHESTMYYPMRVVRTRKHKLIVNLAHQLPFPFASDLWASSAWQDALRRGPDAAWGKRTVKSYQHRPRFELFDLEADPDEVRNLADDPAHAKLLASLQDRVKTFQQRTRDPWILKWERE
jgi:N-sulfoglucosamine sulfohydrolase